MFAETAQALGLSEGAVKFAVHRMRKRFRELLSEEIADTVSSRSGRRRDPASAQHRVELDRSCLAKAA